MAKKTKSVSLDSAKSYEDFSTVVKQQIGEASEEVLQAWFAERTAKPAAKKPADTPPAE